MGELGSRAMEGRVEGIYITPEPGELPATVPSVRALAGRGLEGNRYFDEQAPWRLVKQDRAACAAVMGDLLWLVNALKVMLAPFLPFSSARLHELLGYQDALEAHGWRVEPLPAGQALPTPTPLFRKLEE